MERKTLPSTDKQLDSRNCKKLKKLQKLLKINKAGIP